MILVRFDGSKSRRYTPNVLFSWATEPERNRNVSNKEHVLNIYE